METRHTLETGVAYKHFAPGHWQHIDTNDGQNAPVGPVYKTKIELLIDDTRYQIEGWGATE